MTTKNPYEIRLEILKMAKDMLELNYNENVNLAHRIIDTISNDADSKFENPQKLFDDIKPKMFTPSEILEKANELYAFVESRPQAT